MPAVKIKSRLVLQQTQAGQFEAAGRLLYAEPVAAGNYEYGGTFIFSDHPDFNKLSLFPIESITKSISCPFIVIFVILSLDPK